MNDTHFESALRTALPAPDAPLSLDAKIDRALTHHNRVRLVKRRLVLSFASTAVLAFGFVAFPAVQAQASISGIFRALDKQTQVRITTSTIDEQGRRWPNATTMIAGGDIAYVDTKGTRQNFDIGDNTYTLDPTIKRFVVHPRRPGGSIRVSDMLSGASGFSLGKRADLKRLRVQGADVLRVTIVNRGLPERYIIDADPQTDLPIRGQVEEKEQGIWRIRQVLDFDYSAPVSAIKPDFKRYPVTTKEAAEAAFESAMTADQLAEVRFKKGRLVIRKLDLAQDGTVYAAFQTGDRRSRTYSGNGLEIQDDLGTRYVQRYQFFGDSEGPFRSPDGRIEAAVFVPADPIAPNVARTVIISTQKGPKGNFVRMNEWFVRHPDGRLEPRYGPNYFGNESGDPTAVKVLDKRMPGATCDTHPAWMSRLDFSSFGNPVAADMTKAGIRAKEAMARKDWPEAEKQLNEELRLKREHERQGYSPWSLQDTLENLDKVRAAQRP